MREMSERVILVSQIMLTEQRERVSLFASAPAATGAAGARCSNPGPGYSQSRRLKMKYRLTHTTAIRPIANG